MVHKETHELLHQLQTHPRTLAVAILGFCRMWTKEAIFVAKKYRQETGAQFVLQAREVKIDSLLSHTFLRIIIDNISYICDGTGTVQHQPYFGPEETAPAHFFPSTQDPIQLYDLFDEKTI